MNERIKLLAEQAGLVRVGDFGMKRWEGPRSDSISDQDLEKFAELIVKECIITIQMGISRDGQTTEKYQRSIKHIKQIKEHFGVE